MAINGANKDLVQEVCMCVYLNGETVHLDLLHGTGTTVRRIHLHMMVRRRSPDKNCSCKADCELWGEFRSSSEQIWTQLLYVILEEC